MPDRSPQVVGASVLIVGGGQGGAQAAIMLRQQGFTGPIVLVSEESDPPYDRPPLSKDYLEGSLSFERLLFRSPDSWSDLGVQLKLGAQVVAVDARARHATLASGERLHYGRLIWAAGGRARRLQCPGATLEGVHNIRSRLDVDRLRAALNETASAAIVGGGYIGLEAAAVLTKLGKRVTLLEVEDRVLARTAGPPLSRFYETEHRRRGVDLRLNARVKRLEGADGRVSAAVLADGSQVQADLMIVGIGIAPNIEPLQAAGAATGLGVKIDDACRTSLPGIFAVGDCAEHESRFADGASVRLESIQNANDQAAVAARAICGQPARYTATPWFWSNQYDLKLQSVGLSLGYDDLVVRGDAAQRSFSVVYLRNGKVVALDCVNAVRDFNHGRRLVTIGARPERSALADPNVPLKAFG
jgi:3-phenylpropionate/trans-cinnamate dioxygenase ferredoxin reductase subunit